MQASQQAQEHQAGDTPELSRLQQIERRAFFKYEKRLRKFSTHEKMFEYFSSSKNDAGQPSMSAADVLRALLCIYPPDQAEWKRCGSLPGEAKPPPTLEHVLSARTRKFLADFDLDGNNSYSLDEFVLILVLLSMPLRDMQAIFTLMDADGSGELSKDEFTEAVDGLLSLRDHQAKGSIGRGRLDASKQGGSDNATEPFIAKWFGADGSGRLKLAEFQKFIIDLHMVFDEMEFATLDVNNSGHITGLDLARSLAAPASIKLVDGLLDRCEELPDELRDAKISWQDFQYAQLLVAKFHRIGFPLRFWQNTKNDVTADSARRLLERVCKTQLPRAVVAIFEHVFVDDDGQWDVAAMHTALKGKYQHVSYMGPLGDEGIIACFLNCLQPKQP